MEQQKINSINKSEEDINSKDSNTNNANQIQNPKESAEISQENNKILTKKEQGGNLLNIIQKLSKPKLQNIPIQKELNDPIKKEPIKSDELNQAKPNNTKKEQIIQKQPIKSSLPENKNQNEKKIKFEKIKKPINQIPDPIKVDPNQKKTHNRFFETYESFISELGNWQKYLESFISKPNNKKMISIYNFVKSEYNTKLIHPPKDKIFTAFKLTPFESIKVVILGQDPYPNPGDAMGLSFSVPRTQRRPQSLFNIYKCLFNDPKIKFEIPSHGDLTSWAQQGVFMLNSTLTVISKNSNSHQKISGWNFFTDFVISQINLLKEHVVFLLWGNFAIEKEKLINTNKHLVIKNIHPSPLAQKKGDFTKSDQFSKTNEYLKQNGITEINWQIPK